VSVFHAFLTVSLSCALLVDVPREAAADRPRLEKELADALALLEREAAVASLRTELAKA
jgi:hypothetical protein